MKVHLLSDQEFGVLLEAYCELHKGRIRVREASEKEPALFESLSSEHQEWWLTRWKFEGRIPTLSRVHGGSTKVGDTDVHVVGVVGEPNEP